MNDLVTDVKSLELETLQNLKSSKAQILSVLIKLIIRTLLVSVLKMLLNQCHQNQKL